MEKTKQDERDIKDSNKNNKKLSNVDAAAPITISTTVSTTVSTELYSIVKFTESGINSLGWQH